MFEQLIVKSATEVKLISFLNNKQLVKDFMKLEAFKPIIRPGDKYAVAVPVEGGGVCIIGTYPSREQLENGYRDYNSYANKKGITRPVPVEIVDQKTMMVKILKDLIE